MWGIVILIVVVLAIICMVFPAIIGQLLMGLVELMGALLEAFCD